MRKSGVWMVVATLGLPAAALAQSQWEESPEYVQQDEEAMQMKGDEKRIKVQGLAGVMSYAGEAASVRELRAVAKERGNFEPVDAKAALGGISRKWLIPLLEFYDKLGATRRDGNARLFTRKGEAMAERGIDAT